MGKEPPVARRHPLLNSRNELLSQGKASGLSIAGPRTHTLAAAALAFAFIHVLGSLWLTGRNGSFVALALVRAQSVNTSFTAIALKSTSPFRQRRQMVLLPPAQCTHLRRQRRHDSNTRARIRCGCYVVQKTSTALFTASPRDEVEDEQDSSRAFSRDSLCTQVSLGNEPVSTGPTMGGCEMVVLDTCMVYEVACGGVGIGRTCVTTELLLLVIWGTQKGGASLCQIQP